MANGYPTGGYRGRGFQTGPGNYYDRNSFFGTDVRRGVNANVNQRRGAVGSPRVPKAPRRRGAISPRKYGFYGGVAAIAGAFYAWNRNPSGPNSAVQIDPEGMIVPAGYSLQKTFDPVPYSWGYNNGQYQGEFNGYRNTNFTRSSQNSSSLYWTDVKYEDEPATNPSHRGLDVFEKATGTLKYGGGPWTRYVVREWWGLDPAGLGRQRIEKTVWTDPAPEIAIIPQVTPAGAFVTPGRVAWRNLDDWQFFKGQVSPDPYTQPEGVGTPPITSVEIEVTPDNNVKSRPGQDHSFDPPGRNTQEKKGRTRTGAAWEAVESFFGSGGKIKKTLDAATEAADAVDAVFFAIDEAVRPAGRLTVWEKAQFIAENIEHLDFDRMVFNLAVMQVTDTIGGQVAQKSLKSRRAVSNSYGSDRYATHFGKWL